MTLEFNPMSALAGQGGNFSDPPSLQANNAYLQSSMPQASAGKSFGFIKNIISPLMGLAGGFLSSGLNAAFAKIAAKRQYKNQVQLMQLQNQMQRDMLTDEMALKMKGYKNAGLSTASLAGNFSNNTAVPGGSAAASQASASDLGNIGNIMNAAKQIKLQELALQSEINLNNANAEAARANAQNSMASAGKTDIESYLLNTYGSRKYEGEIANLDAEEKKTLADRDYLVQKKINEMNLNEKEVQLLQQQYDINWKRLPKELALISAQAYREMEQGNLARKTGEEVQQKIYNLQRERDNIVRQGYLTDLQADLIEAEIAKLKSENENLTPSAIYNKMKSYLMNKFPRLVKAGVAFDTTLSYVREFAEIYSKFKR